MKKLLFLIVGLSFIISCAADEKKEVGTSENETLVFGNIVRDMKDVWNASSVKAFEYAADKKNVEVIILDSENDLEKSVALMEELIQREVDGISIYPISPDQATTLIRMANNANIPVTIENYPLDPSAGDFVATIAAKYATIGAKAVTYISEKWPGSKVLFAAGAKGDGVYEEYQAGIDQALLDTGNKISIVGIVHGDWQTEKTLNVVQNFIQTGKEFDVVFANNELMAQGAYRALKEAGLEDKVKIVSTGGSGYGLDMIRNGELTATMSAPVSLQGLITFRNLYQHANGRTPPKAETLPTIAVDIDNIDSAISWDVSDSAIDFIGGLE